MLALLVIFLLLIMTMPLIQKKETPSIFPQQHRVTKISKNEMYAGTINIRTSHENHSDMFYWFFPCRNVHAPLILWLQGGPGTSSMVGLFYEIGPLMLVNKSIVEREINWSKKYHLLFVDSPVGAGFSHVTPFSWLEGYPRNAYESALDLRLFLLKFYSQYSALKQSPLFLAGESYAGRYVPHLACLLLEHKSDFVLQGIMLGNPTVDPLTQNRDMATLAYNFGLIDIPERNEIEQKQQELRNCLLKNDLIGAFKLRKAIFSLVGSLTGVNLYDVRSTEAYDYSDLIAFMNRSKRQLHVPDSARFTRHSSFVMALFNGDMMNNTMHEMRSLLRNKVRVLIYQGQFDYHDGVSSALEWIEKVVDKNETSTKKTFITSTGEKAGWIKSFEYLTFCMIMRAGHMSPRDSPYAVHELIDKFIQKNKSRL